MREKHLKSHVNSRSAIQKSEYTETRILVSVFEPHTQQNAISESIVSTYLIKGWMVFD